MLHAGSRPPFARQAAQDLALAALPPALIAAAAAGRWPLGGKLQASRRFCVCGTGTGCRLVSAFGAAHGVRYHCISTLDTTDEEEAFIAAVLSLNLHYP